MESLYNLPEMGQETSLKKFEVNIHFVLSSEQYKSVFAYLLNQQIPFQIVYSPTNYSVSLKNDISVNEVPIPKSSNRTQKWSAIIEEIYQKYIIGMLNNPVPTEKEIAEEFNLTLSSFKKHFIQIYHNPFYQVYLAKKMNYGAELLLQGYKAKVVSEMLGYKPKSSIKFNKMFQKHFGITPRKYQILNLVNPQIVKKFIQKTQSTATKRKTKNYQK